MCGGAVASSHIVEGEPTLSLDESFYKEIDLTSFRPNAKTFNIENGWQLSKISELAYHPPKIVGNIFKTIGFLKIKFLSKKTTQAYILTAENYTIISFRGTEVYKKRNAGLEQMLYDLTTDADSIFTKSYDGKGLIHKGFNKSLNNIWDELFQYISSQSNNHNIWITGHSLGGALATISADRLQKKGIKVQGIYTFGSPRVGNIDFKNNFKVSHYRVVNHNDIVSQVPLNEFHLFEKEYYTFQNESNKTEINWLTRLVYVHIGKLFYIDKDGRSHNLIDKEKSKQKIYSPDSLADHSLDEYSKNLQNLK